MKVSLFIVLSLVNYFFFTPKVRAHEGWGILLDRNGNIYFADIPKNKIWKLTREGNLQVAVADQHSHALVHGADGTIYGSHENGRIWKLSDNGKYSEILLPSPTFPLSLHPFIIDAGGNIYSMNANRVQTGQVFLFKRSPDGRVDTIAGSKKGYKDGKGMDAEFTGIDGMAWGRDSLLYITDGPFVRTVTTDGIVATIAGKLTEERLGEDLMGLIVGASGNILVADYSRQRVLQISDDGKNKTIYNSGGIWSPTGVAEAAKDIYVLEHLRGWFVLLGNIGVGPYIRIIKLSPDGKATTLTTVWGSNTVVFIITLFIIAFLIFLRHSRRKRRLRRMTSN